MKNQIPQKSGHIRQLGLAALLIFGVSAAPAQTPLYTDHTDVGIDYDETLNAWNLHVHHEATDTEYSPPTDALLVVRSQALTTVPVGAAWSFLGTAGANSWILPKTQNPDLLFLGIGSEEIAAGTFVNDEFTLALKSVSGPGGFAVFDLDSFGDPLVLMNSVDGISAADAVVFASGTHNHVNWAFSAPGDYSVTFAASANSVLNGQTSSGDVTYLFRVEAVPEPGSAALVSLGAVAIWWVRRSKRN